MSVKLYIGNLDYTVTSDQLAQFFSQIGPVLSATVITDRYSGRSRGFGFVEFEDEKLAKEAIAKLNGQPFNDRNLVVNEARPQEQRQPRENRGQDDRRRSYN